MIKKETFISLDYLRGILKFDQETGIFTWNWRDDVRYQTNCRFFGKEAGCTSHGYKRIKINVIPYEAHRLAWFYMNGEWPLDFIDHKDLVRAKNSKENLRLADRSQNNHNTGAYNNSKSGIKGVSWNKAKKRWIAQIKKDGKVIHVGCFMDINKAISAYALKASELYGEFARTAA